MIHKTKKVIVFCCLLLFLLNGCQQKDKDINVGAILALTGSIGNQGEWVKNGLELGREEIDKINGKELKIFYEDAQANQNLAISGYNALRVQHEIPIVITMGSSVGIALSPIANEDQVIQMGVATASPAYSRKNDFNFRTFETATLETKNIAQEIKNRFKHNRVSILWINNDYGKGVKEAFEHSFKEIGGTIVSSDAFEEGATDLRTELLKVKAKNPDAIFLAPYTKEGGLIIKQLTELDIDLPTFSSQAILGGEELFDIVGEKANGLIIAAPRFDIESEEEHIKKFRETHNKKYGKDPEIYSARAYDAIKILGKAIEHCKDHEDTICVKEYLFTIKDYKGVSGTISFDENGDVIRPFELKIIKNMKVMPYREEQ